MEGLSRDPWGRPYKRIMGTIRDNDYNICERLSVQVIGNIIGKLFPRGKGVSRNREIREIDDSGGVPEISNEEFESIIKSTRKKGNKAPGPDGMQARLLKRRNVPKKHLGDCIMGALRPGIFQLDGR